MAYGLSLHYFTPLGRSKSLWCRQLWLCHRHLGTSWSCNPLYQDLLWDRAKLLELPSLFRATALPWTTFSDHQNLQNLRTFGLHWSVRLKTSTVLYIIGTSPYYLIREPVRTITSINLHIHCILLSPLLDLLTSIHIFYSLFNLSSFHSFLSRPCSDLLFLAPSIYFDFVTAQYSWVRNTRKTQDHKRSTGVESSWVN